MRCLSVWLATSVDVQNLPGWVGPASELTPMNRKIHNCSMPSSAISAELSACLSWECAWVAQSWAKELKCVKIKCQSSIGPLSHLPPPVTRNASRGTRSPYSHMHGKSMWDIFRILDILNTFSGSFYFFFPTHVIWYFFCWFRDFQNKYNVKL